MTISLKRKVQKYENWSTIPLRIALGLSFIIHGYTKISSGVDGFAVNMGLPLVIAWLVCLAEFGGGIAVLTGVATRIASALIGVVMIGAIVLVHWGQGFYAMELPLVFLLISISLVLTGAGKKLNLGRKWFDSDW